MQTLSRLASVFFNLFEPLFRVGQRWLGLSRIGWLFVGPNLLVFGLFTFLPIVVNFVYVLGGTFLMHRRMLRGELLRWYRSDFIPPAFASLAVAGIAAALMAMTLRPRSPRPVVLAVAA